ncbi:hypothetical protein [Rhodococcus maanshanensis]|uniref:Uncharacterized protein n=2 Tax=Rhodococcus maanshanensis TaxID=183556 RepID=A0A1H7LKQ4_9NOCA|nr:hypothetical protein [Rhodococcus maanshanensis]SEK98957.1 hypothetical protein SAMN05444583_10571 [Rhodococcus maanshanensis]
MMQFTPVGFLFVEFTHQPRSNMRLSLILRRISVAVASAAVLTLTFAGQAGASPTAVEPPGSAPAALVAESGMQSPEALAVLQTILGAAALGPLGLPEFGVTRPQDFMYPAPTLGCGVGETPVTVTVASAQAGPNFPLPPFIERGQLRFQALPAHVDFPKQSGLSVIWFNTTTFKGGMEPLNDVLLGVPTMSKTVATGAGTVLAALYGDVTYQSGKTCFALPTVGTFTA